MPSFATTELLPNELHYINPEKLKTFSRDKGQCNLSQISGKPIQDCDTFSLKSNIGKYDLSFEEMLDF